MCPLCPTSVNKKYIWTSTNVYLAILIWFFLWLMSRYSLHIRLNKPCSGSVFDPTESPFTPTSSFSVWSKLNFQVSDLPWTIGRTKQPNDCQTKWGGLVLDQTEPWFGLFPVWNVLSDVQIFWPITGTFWQAIIKRWRVLWGLSA